MKLKQQKKTPLFRHFHSSPCYKKGEARIYRYGLEFNQHNEDSKEPGLRKRRENKLTYKFSCHYIVLSINNMLHKIEKKMLTSKDNKNKTFYVTWKINYAPR
jgi:hypothetical protein